MRKDEKRYSGKNICRNKRYEHKRVVRILQREWHFDKATARKIQLFGSLTNLSNHREICLKLYVFYHYFLYFFNKKSLKIPIFARQINYRKINIL